MSPRFLSPANSIIFMIVIVVVLALTGSFVWLAIVSTLARMIVYSSTIAALPLTQAASRITVPHWISGAAGMMICLWGAAQAKADAWIALLSLSAVGLGLYWVARMLVRPIKPT